MRKIVLLALAFVLSLSVSALPAQAKAFRGVPKLYYAELNTGLNFGRETDVDLPNTSSSGSFSFENGFLFGGSLGYDFGNFRLDGEVGYAKPDFDKITLGSQQANGDGDLEVLTFMLNGYYDFNNSTRFIPFIGGGAGVGKLNMDSPSPALIQNTESDLVFAYQFTAGTAYQFTKSFSLLASYRYLGTTEGEFDTQAPSIGFSGKTKQDYSAHQIRIGGRFSF